MTTDTKEYKDREQDWLKLGDILLFGGNREGLEYLDNFFEHDFEVSRKRYSTVEHYFQAAKFLNEAPEYAEQIRNSQSGAEAKRLGREKKVDLTSWKAGGSVQAMKTALAAKFAKGSDLAERLVRDTGNKVLVEKVEDECV